MLSRTAERYVRLALAIGQHDPHYVDAYFGDPTWKPTGAPQPPAALLEEARSARSALRVSGEPPAADPLLALRFAYLDRQLVTLPVGETFTVEYVTGKAWSAYNWFKGSATSVIQVNTDLPVTIDRALDLACHEGYPGHHVYQSLLEQALVRDRGWVEFTIYPLFSPQSLISEGTANFGIEVAFPDADRVAFERDVLYPAAGLDPTAAETFTTVQRLIDQLTYAGNDAARRYLDGEIDRAEAIAWLARWAMMPADRAERRTHFFDRYRSYVINYNVGLDLVRAYIERRGGTPDRPDVRWREFEALLSSPRVPSGLR